MPKNECGRLPFEEKSMKQESQEQSPKKFATCPEKWFGAKNHPSPQGGQGQIAKYAISLIIDIFCVQNRLMKNYHSLYSLDAVNF